MAGDENPASLGSERIEAEEDLKDEGELPTFGLFASAIEDLYTGIVDKYVRNTPAVWEEFAQRLSTGEMYLVDPDPYAPIPTVPTAENICLDIHNNLRFSPRFCFWAVERKLAETHENLVPGTFAKFVFNELKDYVERRSELQDNFYKHLVINTQTRTFEDPHYVNSIGSKVVIRPLAETLELSIKKEHQLQHHKMQLLLETHHQMRYQRQQRSVQLLLETHHQVRYQRQQSSLQLGTCHQARCQWQMRQQKFLNTYHQVRNQELKLRKKMWRWKHLKNNIKKNLHKMIL